jgi:hypothetical protein
MKEDQIRLPAEKIQDCKQLIETSKSTIPDSLAKKLDFQPTIDLHYAVKENHEENVLMSEFAKESMN